ncbi:proline dehydrogenase 1, mitochondrial-like [Agrilus planipennis]|nr:proline dehydrogenase 1, mitochondrial-like [Agrilus planipennis]
MEALDLGFEDIRDAYKSKTLWELARGLLVFKLCGNNIIMDNNQNILRNTRHILGDRLFKWLMKLTFYGHFVAGEDENRIQPTLQQLRSFGVNPILDYSVEEDISKEEAEKREVAASVPEAGDKIDVEGSLKQYHVNKKFADRRYKVTSAHTFFYINEANCERNMVSFIKCIEAVAGYPHGKGFAAIKLTGLGRPQLLLQLSEVIMRTRKFMTQLVGEEGNVLRHHLKPEDLKKKLECFGSKFNVDDFLKKVTADKEGILHLFPWSGIINDELQLDHTFLIPCLKTGEMVPLITQLSEHEQKTFKNMIRRMKTIAKIADELNVYVAIDAEQTYFQPAISRIAIELMRLYNKDEAVIWTTYQAYLKDGYNELCSDLEQAKRQNFCFGAKLVRGAYLEQERARAREIGYSDPTNSSYEATTEMYHRMIDKCLKRIKEHKELNEMHKISIMVATHSEDSIRYSLDRMKALELKPEDKVVSIGQLLGMCDHVSFPLAQAGYRVFKYVPYGPVTEVMPYLARRVAENKAVLLKVEKEKALLMKEIMRRVGCGEVFYKPRGNYCPV